MKKILLTVALAASAYATAQAQGLVIFNNGSTTRISTNAVVGGSGSGLVAANSSQLFYYALFMSTSQTTVGGSSASVAPTVGSNGTYVFNAANSGSWTQVAIATNSSAGRLFSSSTDANGNTAISGLAAGSSAQFVVVGWSANLGSTISQVAAGLGSTAGWLGESVVSGSITAGDGVNVPASATFGSGSPFIQGFTLGLIPVPEPTTLALAGLSGASLLLFRRRK